MQDLEFEEKEEKEGSGRHTGTILPWVGSAPDRCAVRDGGLLLFTRSRFEALLSTSSVTPSRDSCCRQRGPAPSDVARCRCREGRGATPLARTSGWSQRRKSLSVRTACVELAFCREVSRPLMLGHMLRLRTIWPWESSTLCRCHHRSRRGVAV